MNVQCKNIGFITETFPFESNHVSRFKYFFLFLVHIFKIVIQQLFIMTEFRKCGYCACSSIKKILWRTKTKLNMFVFLSFRNLNKQFYSHLSMTLSFIKVPRKHLFQDFLVILKRTELLAELLENLKEMFHRYYMDSDVINIIKYSITHWCVLPVAKGFIEPVE